MVDHTQREDAISTAQKLMGKDGLRKKAEEKLIENEQEYSKALNKIFTSDEGMLFGKYLLRYCNMFAVDKTGNNAKLVEDAMKRKVYTEFVRPYLELPVRKELENQE